MLKKDARKLYNQKRKEVSYADRMKWDDLILINFQTIEMPFLDAVFSFYPMEERNEVNAFLLTDYLHFRNLSVQICYPKMAIKEPNMEAVACKADTVFEANEINILEPVETTVVPPEEIDLVLVPMLVCDVRGNRVG
jgi:5-formyltetrahydrofolate cyclo-ligase